MFRFQNPYFFILILFIPLLWRYLKVWRKKSGAFVRYSSFVTLNRMKGHSPQFKSLVPYFLRALTLFFIICALARPQFGTKTSEIISDGVDIILAIDTSFSMNALDFKFEDKRYNRLDIVKKVVSDFIKKRKDDRLGMVVFGDEAYTQCPLTLDHGILVNLLNKLKIGMVGRSTAIGSAIGISVKRLKDLKAKSKVIILLSDGENTAGIDPIKATEIAKGYGVKIYTIGVGSNGQVPFLQDTFFGKTYRYIDVRLDEKLLKDIADTTGGEYFRASGTEELIKVYNEIDKLEKTEIKTKEYMDFNEKYAFWVILALISLMVEIVLANTILRRLP